MSPVRELQNMADDSDQLYRNMFEKAVEGMYRTSTDGQYLEANLALARMHGCQSVDEFKSIFGVTMSAYARLEDRDRFVSIIAEKGELHAVEFLGQRLDGSTFWMLESGRALYDEEGEVVGFEGIVEDISNLRTIERELQEARHLAETADRLKTELLSNIGHELRSPLNAIIGFSEMISRLGRDRQCDSEIAAYANEINENADRLLVVINSLLEFSDINAGLNSQAFDMVDVIALIHSIERRFAARFKEKKLSFNIRLCSVTPALHSEERALRRALENILSNAIKFTPEGGEVSLCLSLTEPGGLSLQVVDSGIGLEKDGLDRAMAPFEQVDSSLSRHFEGVGLGLPMARSLVEQLGGSFAIRSTPGAGTAVTFQFPSDLVTVMHKV